MWAAAKRLSKAVGAGATPSTGRRAAPVPTAGMSTAPSRWRSEKRFRRGIDKRATELTLRRMARSYLPYTLDQRLLLPPDMRAWLPEGHLALFVLDVVSVLDLSAIHTRCTKPRTSEDERGSTLG